MSERRNLVVEVRTGQTRPAMPSVPVLSSASLGWEGVLLEQHSSCAVENMEISPQDHVVIVQLGGPSLIELKMGNEAPRSVEALPGDVGIFPALMPLSAKTAASGDVLTLSITPRFLLFAAHELIPHDRFELTPRFPIQDPFLRELGS